MVPQGRPQVVDVDAKRQLELDVNCSQPETLIRPDAQVRVHKTTCIKSSSA